MTNQTHPQPKLDEYEDLTRFADENFDTDEVDLFQFSGNSETSPLTKLKSVILSLEWEITDEYLQELAEELAALAPSLQDDKVANLYLQGMGKIGKYLRLRGAHAHANAIKLLLRYFYDFESILNSPEMDNERINKVVQNDVRMFRVLQYQIKLAEEGSGENEGEGPAGMTKAVVRDTGKAGNALRSFKAAVLELDWEVSDSSLQLFSDALKALGEEEIQNKSALILIQGMQALGQYISEERAHAHPEVFNLLHAFHDGLERILDTGPAALDQKQKKRILVDRINRLNHLKKLIAPQDSEVPEAVPLAQAVADARSRGSAAPAPEEAPPATASEAPDEERALFDDVTPALADAPVPEAPDEETALFDDNVAPALADAETLEVAAEEPALFDDVPPALADADAPAAPAADIPGVYTDDYDDDDVDPRFGGVTPALADASAEEQALFDDITPALADEEPGPVASFSETEMDSKPSRTSGDGIAAEIDDIFASGAKRTMLGQLEAYPDEVLPASAIQAVDDEVADGFIDDSVGKRSEIAPALADADIDPPLGGEEDASAEGDAELDMQLDSFFGDSSAPPPPPEAPVEPAAPASVLSGEGDDDDDDELGLFPPTSHSDDLPSALADADAPEETLELGSEDAELSAKLDSFFDFPSEPAPAAGTPAAPVGETGESLSLDADLFADEPAPALADAETPAVPAAETEESLSLDADLFADEPAPALADAETPAVPANDTLLFEEESAAPVADAEEEDTLFIIEESASPTTPDELALFEAAPAASVDETFLFEENAVAPTVPTEAALDDDIPPALFDAEHPEEADEELIFEANEELSAHLDGFFGNTPGDQPPAPADEPVPAETAPADDMLLFEEEPVASVTPVDDASLFAAEAPAAPADGASLFTDEPATQVEAIPDEPIAALANADPEQERLSLEADEELSAHLDDFFDIPGEPASEAPAVPASPVGEAGDAMLFTDEPISPVAENPAEESGLFLDESDLAAEATAAPAVEEPTLFADEPTASVAAESPAEESGGLFLDESDLALEAQEEGEAMLFADAPADEAPALDIPEEEREVAQPKVFEDVVAALADVEPARGKAPRVAADADSGFQSQLDSFFDVPQTEKAPPSEEENAAIFGETPEPAETPAKEAVASAPADDALLFEETLVEPPATRVDDTLLFEESEEKPTATPAGDAPLFAETTSSDTLTLDENLFGPAEGELAAPTANEEEALRLEKKAAPADFDDLVDPEELHDFMMSDGDIEDISDEELAMVEEEEAAIRLTPPEDLPLEETLPGAFDEPAPHQQVFEDEENTLAAMDDLFGAQDEGPAPEAELPAPIEEETLSAEDMFADERVLFTKEQPALATQDVAGEALLFADESQAADDVPAVEESLAVPSTPAMFALSESLPALLAGYTADQLAVCRSQLDELRQDGGLSRVQQAAAGMLESVLDGMPEKADHTDSATGTVLGDLYSALAEPQAQLPIDTVTAYSAWVQSQVSATRRLAPAPGSDSRDLLRELSEFRARMEQELAELREELKKR